MAKIRTEGLRDYGAELSPSIPSKSLRAWKL